MEFPIGAISNTLERKEKEKITPVFLHRHDCELVGHILITGFHDAVCGFMPLLVLK
jgi:hypothetical protein